jgi:hypothetical protein
MNRLCRTLLVMVAGAAAVLPAGPAVATGRLPIPVSSCVLDLRSTGPCDLGTAGRRDGERALPPVPSAGGLALGGGRGLPGLTGISDASRVGARPSTPQHGRLMGPPSTAAGRVLAHCG